MILFVYGINYMYIFTPLLVNLIDLFRTTSIFAYKICTNFSVSVHFLLPLSTFFTISHFIFVSLVICLCIFSRLIFIFGSFTPPFISSRHTWSSFPILATLSTIGQRYTVLFCTSHDLYLILPPQLLISK